MRIGNDVAQRVVFTYAFPLDGDTVLYPVYQPGSIAYGSIRMSREEFEWRFVGSYASTALNYPEGSALEGSLHEVEHLNPWLRSRNDSPSVQLMLQGYVFVNETCLDEWWSSAKDALAEHRLGGEGRYGFGRVRGMVDEVAPDELLFGQYVYDLRAHRPRVHVPQGSPVLAHTLIGDGWTADSGEVEPLVGRNWNDQLGGAGRGLVTLAAACLAPGSTLKDPHWVEIGADGVWRPADTSEQTV
jgi:hypothetical protein